jgi:hypothetical protein
MDMVETKPKPVLTVEIVCALFDRILFKEEKKALVEMNSHTDHQP